MWRAAMIRLMVKALDLVLAKAAGSDLPVGRVDEKKRADG